jgi:hypothetical protein
MNQPGSERNEKDLVLRYFERSGKRLVVLEEFFIKLSELGIDYPIGLEPNNHIEYYELRLYNPELYISDEKLLKKVTTLVSRYEKLLNKTCETCGKKITNFSGVDLFCAKCFQLIKKKWNYEDISNLGFSDYIDDERHFFYWEEFARAEFVFDIERFTPFSKKFPNTIDLYYNKEKVIIIDPQEPVLTITELCNRLNNWHEGFYTIIKYLPDNLLNEADRLIKQDVIYNRKDCGICGYKSALEGKGCVVCNYPFHTLLTERMEKRYSTVNEVNKRMQMMYAWESKSKYRYPQWEKEFEKSENFIKLYTDEELRQFLKKR